MPLGRASWEGLLGVPLGRASWECLLGVPLGSASWESLLAARGISDPLTARGKGGAPLVPQTP